MYAIVLSRISKAAARETIKYIRTCCVQAAFRERPVVSARYTVVQDVAGYSRGMQQYQPSEVRTLKAYIKLDV